MILVVDDHVDTAAFVCRFLQRRGYQTCCANDGREALAMMAKLTPELLILDVQMPHLNGLEVLEMMQRDERLKAVPVMVYSAGHDKQEYDRAMRLGARAFLVKGAVGVPELLAEIAKHKAPGTPGDPADGKADRAH